MPDWEPWLQRRLRFLARQEALIRDRSRFLNQGEGFTIPCNHGFHSAAEPQPMERGSASRSSPQNPRRIETSVAQGCSVAQGSRSPQRGGRRTAKVIYKEADRFNNFTGLVQPSVALRLRATTPSTCSTSWVRSAQSYPRSEERRVGKECRSRWSPDH